MYLTVKTFFSLEVNSPVLCYAVLCTTGAESVITEVS